MAKIHLEQLGRGDTEGFGIIANPSMARIILISQSLLFCQTIDCLQLQTVLLLASLEMNIRLGYSGPIWDGNPWTIYTESEAEMRQSPRFQVDSPLKRFFHFLVQENH